MILTIEPTEQFFMAGAAMVRLWQGHDGHGTPVVAFVAMVGFPGQAEELALNLVSIPPPDAAAAQEWARKVMEGAAEQPAKPDA